MRRITIVRHGEAAAGWGADIDPGLSDLGNRQSAAVAERLADSATRSLIVTSPLRRCQETAAPLSLRWGIEPTIDPRVAEIPSPDLSLEERGPWLRKIMAGTWTDAGAGLAAWRSQVFSAICELPDGAVVFSHYVALNAIVGAITGDDRVVCFHPDNCSATIVDVGLDSPIVVELGGEARTIVN